MQVRKHSKYMSASRPELEGPDPVLVVRLSSFQYFCMFCPTLWHGRAHGTCVPKEPGMRGGQVLSRSYRTSNRSQKVVMRHVYMLSPRIERLGSEFAVYMDTSPLARV